MLGLFEVIASDISYPEIDQIRSIIFQKSEISQNQIDFDLNQELDNGDCHSMGWKLITYTEYLCFQGKYKEAEDILSRHANSPCNTDYQYWQIGHYMLNYYSFQYRKCLNYLMSLDFDNLYSQSSSLYHFLNINQMRLYLTADDIGMGQVLGISGLYSKEDCLAIISYYENSKTFLAENALTKLALKVQFSSSPSELLNGTQDALTVDKTVLKKFDLRSKRAEILKRYYTWLSIAVSKILPGEPLNDEQVALSNDTQDSIVKMFYDATGKFFSPLECFEIFERQLPLNSDYQFSLLNTIGQSLAKDSCVDFYNEISKLLCNVVKQEYYESIGSTNAAANTLMKISNAFQCEEVYDVLANKYQRRSMLQMIEYQYLYSSGVDDFRWPISDKYFLDMAELYLSYYSDTTSFLSNDELINYCSVMIGVYKLLGLDYSIFLIQKIILYLQLKKV